MPLDQCRMEGIIYGDESNLKEFSQYLNVKSKFKDKLKKVSIKEITVDEKKKGIYFQELIYPGYETYFYEYMPEFKNMRHFDPD